MNDKTKHIVQTVIFLLILFSLAFVCWTKPADAYSESERRELAQMPEISFDSLTSGKFMSEFEEYTLDQFPERDLFRRIKAYTSTYVLRQKDNNNLYVSDGYIAKVEYPMNKDSIAYASKKFNDIYEKYLKETGSKVYFAVIPDKNAFLADESGHLKMDYDLFYEQMMKENDYGVHIPIYELLSKEDYYLTDTHWKQEMITDVAEEIAFQMGSVIKNDYNVVKLDVPFYGVYYGQSALPLDADKLCYLENDIINSMVVYDHQNGRNIAVYEMDKVQGKDPYEMFLGGPLSLVTIENPMAETDKELIVFRDSFGSSIAPLLAQGYSKVTLVDIRYISSTILESYIDFNGEDVLFLYSTQVLNNSNTIK